MNKSQIFDMTALLDDKYILEADTSATKSIRVKKRLPALLIAAAVAVTGTVTAVAVHSHIVGKTVESIWFKDVSEQELEELDSKSRPLGCETVKNSFGNIDFSVDGLTTGINGDYVGDYIWITASRTDGGSFDTSKDYEYFLALDTCCYKGMYADAPRNYDPENDELFWTNDATLVTCRANDDGTLSIALPARIYDDVREDVYIGFGDIIKIRKTYDEQGLPADKEYDERFTKLRQMKNKMIDYRIYEGKAPAYLSDDIMSYSGILISMPTDDSRYEIIKAEYDKWLSEYKKEYTAFAEEVYEGEFIIKTDIDTRVAEK